MRIMIERSSQELPLCPSHQRWQVGQPRHRDIKRVAEECVMKLSQRLQSLPPYHFAEYSRKIAELRASGVDVISLAMGDPDLPTPPEVLDALTQSAQQPINQRYP